MGSPIIRRHRLGNELRQLRAAAGLTGLQVVERLGWASPSKLTRIERGQSRPDLADVLDLLDLYGATGANREKLIAIARDAANTRGWWRSIAEMGARARAYAQLEAGAAEISQYQQFHVPGLLQTVEYARVRMASGLDLHGDIHLEVDTRAREQRQQVLTREEDPVRYEALIEEPALRRNAAPAEVMRGQLCHLLELLRLPNVSVRVVPPDARVGDYYVPHTPFSLYRFVDPDDPTMAVLETLTSDVQLQDEEDIALYVKVFGLIREAALSPEETGTIIERLVNQD